MNTVTPTTNVHGPRDERLARKLAELTATHEQFVRLLNEVLADLHEQANPHSPSRKIQVIQETVAIAYGVTVEEMVGQRRRAWMVLPRHVAMWIARTFTGFPCATIADAFGGRDHGAVIHACRAMDNKRAQDAAFRQTVDELLAKCRERITTDDLPLFHLKSA